MSEEGSRAGFLFTQLGAPCVLCVVRWMGNKSSSSSGAPENTFFEPTGLYPSCAWDVKVVRQLVRKRRLAPRWPGVDEKTAEATESCPICFQVRGAAEKAKAHPPSPRLRDESVGPSARARVCSIPSLSLSLCVSLLTRSDSVSLSPISPQLYPSLNTCTCCRQTICTGTCQRNSHILVQRERERERFDTHVSVVCGVFSHPRVLSSGEASAQAALGVPIL